MNLFRLVIKAPSKFVPYSFLIATSFIAFVAKMPFTGAEDIVNARNNILIGARTDFWGGFAPWFFTIYVGDSWEFVYAVLFALSITLGSIGIARYFLFVVKQFRSNHLISLFLLNYIVLLFALSFSRDGGMLAFSWLGIGLFLFSKCFEESLFPKVLRAISCLFIVLGFSFRPWLSVSLVFLILLLRGFGSGAKKLSPGLILSITFSFLFMPLIIDQFAKKGQSLDSSFPEQQVMIMDASSMACLSPSQTVADQAINTLRNLPDSKNVNRGSLCGQWYPQSWASPVFYGHLSEAEKPALSMIIESDYETYNKFKSAWLNLLLTNLPEYIQAKVILGSQFALAGDSIHLNTNSLDGLLLLPIELLKSLRIFSMLPTVLLLLWLTLRARTMPATNVNKIASVNLLVAFYLSFCLMSVISFIGDNQRYLFNGSILVILFGFLLERGYVK